MHAAIAQSLADADEGHHLLDEELVPLLTRRHRRILGPHPKQRDIREHQEAVAPAVSLLLSRIVVEATVELKGGNRIALPRNEDGVEAAVQPIYDLALATNAPLLFHTCTISEVWRYQKRHAVLSFVSSIQSPDLTPGEVPLYFCNPYLRCPPLSAMFPFHTIQRCAPTGKAESDLCISLYFDS